MSALAHPVISIDSPDAAWARKKVQEKLEIARAVRKDRTLTEGARIAHAAVFDAAWPRRRVTKLQDDWAELAGAPLSSFQRHVKELRERGYVAARRFAYIAELIVNPTRTELEADPVWQRAQERRRNGTERSRKPRFRGEKGRFVSETDPSRMEKDSHHTWNISTTQTIDSKDGKSESSSTYENLSTDAPQLSPVTAAPDDENQNLPVEEKTKAIPKPPRDEFLTWFAEKYGKTASLSSRDLEDIENKFSPYGVTWETFTPACKRLCTGNSSSPIGLVKSIAKQWTQRTQPPKVRTMPPRAPDAVERERKRCSTCNYRTGLLPDGSFCPDCELGRDLAKLAARPARTSRAQSPIFK